MQVLLEAGADVHAVETDSGHTPLLRVALNFWKIVGSVEGVLAVLRMMLDAGADVHATDKVLACVLVVNVLCVSV